MKGSTVLTPYRVEPKALHDLIIMPQFGDVLDMETGQVTVPSDEEGDWQIIDGVVSSRPIMDLFGGQNILKRRDATCKLIYGSVGRLSNRKIETEKLYGAVEDCQTEFYQGCFADYEQENFDLFGAQVLPIMEKGVAADLYANKYFGDVSRGSDVNGLWSWNKFDGIFTWYARYIADGTIPSAQTFTIPAGTLTPTQANAALLTAFQKQDGIFKFFDKKDKAFYVDTDLAEAYYDYLIQSGVTVLQERMSGRPMLYFKGIEVKPKKWDGILAALNGGTAAHAVIFTLQGNFLYAADSAYGGGARNNEAIRIWWSDDDNVWRRTIHMKSGTQLASPAHSVFGMTSF